MAEMNNKEIELAHQVYLEISKSAPHGRGLRVYLDGIEFTEIDDLKFEFTVDSLNMVTMRFPAHITTKETE